MAILTDIWGINSVYEKRLREVGIVHVETLLQVCAMAKQRSFLAWRTGIPSTTILEWVRQADLLRIDGVGPEYARRLREAGVETVPDLSHRNAAVLRKRMMETQEVKSEDCSLPSETEIMGWIEQARDLPCVLQD